MPRRPLHVLTLASALICVGSLIWVGRSAARADIVQGYDIAQGDVTAALTVNGQLLLLWSSVPRSFHCEYRYSSAPAARANRSLDDTWERISGFRVLGIGWSASPDKIIVLPLWLVPILTAILPVRWWRRRRSHTRGFTVVEPTAEHVA